jgi:hypothetical protein
LDGGVHDGDVDGGMVGGQMIKCFSQECKKWR